MISSHCTLPSRELDFWPMSSRKYKVHPSWASHDSSLDRCYTNKDNSGEKDHFIHLALLIICPRSHKVQCLATRWHRVNDCYVDKRHCAVSCIHELRNRTAVTIHLLHKYKWWRQWLGQGQRKRGCCLRFTSNGPDLIFYWYVNVNVTLLSMSRFCTSAQNFDFPFDTCFYQRQGI